MRDKKIGVDLMVSGCTGRGYVRPTKDVPGLLWAELVSLMDEWGRFKKGIKGTRFDRWLKKEGRKA